MGYLDNSGLSHLWSKIKSYLSTNYVSKADADLMTPFAPGDTFDLIGMQLAGCLTGSRKNVHFYIPLPKPISNSVTSVTFPSSLKAYIRHADGGYILSDAAFSTIGTVSTVTKREGGVQLMITLSTASTYTNNAPVTVYFSASSVITFN